MGLTMPKVTESDGGDGTASTSDGKLVKVWKKVTCLMCKKSYESDECKRNWGKC